MIVSAVSVVLKKNASTQWTIPVRRMCRFVKLTSGVGPDRFFPACNGDKFCVLSTPGCSAAEGPEPRSQHQHQHQLWVGCLPMRSINERLTKCEVL